jgi:hypothetical protein
LTQYPGFFRRLNIGRRKRMRLIIGDYHIRLTTGGYMKSIWYAIVLMIVLHVGLRAQIDTVKHDSGVPAGWYSTLPTGWEESVLLQPAGPCKIQTVQLYMGGTGTTTIVMACDPSEGALPPSQYAWGYDVYAVAQNISPAPGWVNLDVSSLNLRSDGYDRFTIQHLCAANGPRFFMDDVTQTSFMNSFYVNPDPQNFMVYGTQGHYLARLLVTYDYRVGRTSQPPPSPTLVDVTLQAGLVDGLGLPIKSARVSAVDWNNDGFDDLVIGSKFFKNNGNGTFTDVSSTINIVAGNGSSWGDFNNDGFLDLYASNSGNPDKIYKNNGNGTFTDVTVASKISNIFPSVTPIWLDYDHDGNLDLFISNGRFENAGTEEYYQDQLWHNNGDGTFTNVTQSCGIPAGEPDPFYDCWGATACDYNNDGWVDLFVSTYRLAPDLLYRNNHDGTFTNVAYETGVRGVLTADTSYFGHGIGCVFGDLDNDGYEDLLVGNLGHPDWRAAVSNPSLVYMNKGPSQNYSFEEKHREKGLKFFEMNAGVVTADLDLDGNLDVFHCQYAYNDAGVSGEPVRLSRVYMNSGAPDYKLEDKTWHLGSLIHGAWTAVRLDYDNDGDEDLLVASPTAGIKLFKNNVAKNGNRPLGIRLKGSPANQVSADGYGSRVRVFMSNGKVVMREIQGAATGTTASQNSNELIFGLGNSGSIDSVVVSWPNGTSRKFTTLLPSRKYTLHYDGTITPVQLQSFSAVVKGNDVTLLWKTATELNNAGFDVQKSVDGKRFTTLASVTGHGTTTEPQDYSYPDRIEVKTWYRLKQIDYDGASSYSPVVEASPGLNNNFTLHQNYPNPFAEWTSIKYSMALESDISILVHDVLGRVVKQLVNERESSGAHEVIWDGTDAEGRAVASGSYFMVIRTGDQILNRVLHVQR